MVTCISLNQSNCILEMSLNSLRITLLYEFTSNDKGLKACEEICGCGNGLPKLAKWFAPFRSKHFDVKYAAYSGQPIVNNIDEIPQNIGMARQCSILTDYTY